MICTIIYYVKGVDDFHNDVLSERVNDWNNDILIERDLTLIYYMTKVNLYGLYTFLPLQCAQGAQQKIVPRW